MSRLKKLYYNCTSLLPWQALPNDSIFPYHHVVSDEHVPHIKNLYPYKNVKQFKADLDFLLKHFEPIAPDDLIQYIHQHNRLPSKKFLLTFDDGFREVHEIIAPILKAKSIPAIFFINPAFIDNKEMFYRNKISLILEKCKDKKKDDYSAYREQLLKIREDKKDTLDEIASELGISFDDYLREKKPWLTSKEVAGLAQQGFTIGGHSWNHPYYQSLSLEEQIKQTTESCDYIRQFQQKHITFSFPHSDANLSQQLFDKLLKSEYGIDLLFGIQNQKNEIHNKMIHRFNCERPNIEIDQQVKGMLIYSLIQKLLNKQRVYRSA